MKIYTREQFLGLPAGTLYTKGEPIAFEGLFLKGYTIYSPQGRAIDWSYRDLLTIAASDTGDLFARVSDMLDNGTSYPLEDAYSRDGTFNAAEVFLVYERSDIREMIAVFQEAEGS